MSLISKILIFTLIIGSIKIGITSNNQKIINKNQGPTKWLKMIFLIDDDEKEVYVTKTKCIPVEELIGQYNYSMLSDYYIGDVNDDSESRVALKYDGKMDGYIQYKNKTYVVKPFLTKNGKSTEKYKVTLADEKNDKGTHIFCEFDINEAQKSELYRNIHGITRSERGSEIGIEIKISVPCGSNNTNISVITECHNNTRNDIPADILDSLCGNGVIDDGEECDCGSPKDCDENGGGFCCDPDTCKNNSRCDCDSGPCCGSNGRFSVGEVCSRGSGQCIGDAKCDGKSSDCPANPELIGTPCANNGACYEGKCRSWLEQCRGLWGNHVTVKDTLQYCFQQNTHGDIYGNCGYDFGKDKFIPCPQNDVQCGKLFCNPIDRDVDYQNYTLKYTYNDCETTIRRDGKWDDKGMIEDMTPCNQDGEHLCFNRTCMYKGDAIRLAQDKISQTAHMKIKSDCVEPFVLDENGSCVNKNAKHQNLSTAVIISAIGIATIMVVIFIIILSVKRKSYKHIQNAD